jgi:hypothetical protein
VALESGGGGGGDGGSTILSGTATPDGTVGNVGDYYLDTDDRILYGPKNATGYGPPVGAYGSRIPVNYEGPTGASNSYGADIKCLVAGRITGLRHYRHASAPAGDTGRTFRLWNGVTLAATAATTGESGSGWRVATLSTPFNVAANDVVRVSEDVLPGVQSTVYNSSLGTWTEGGLQLTGHWEGSSGQRPNSSTPYGRYVDIVFEADPPAVWPVALRSVPPGGTTGQTLDKTSNVDFAANWLNVHTVVTISTSTTATAFTSTNYIYVCSAALTLTLPTAVGNISRYTVKRTGTGDVVVATTASQTIDTLATLVIGVQYQAVDIVSNGANWVVI